MLAYTQTNTKIDEHSQKWKHDSEEDTYTLSYSITPIHPLYGRVSSRVKFQIMSLYDYPNRLSHDTSLPHIPTHTPPYLEESKKGFGTLISTQYWL